MNSSDGGRTLGQMISPPWGTSEHKTTLEDTGMNPTPARIRTRDKSVSAPEDLVRYTARQLRSPDINDC